MKNLSDIFYLYLASCFTAQALGVYSEDIKGWLSDSIEGTDFCSIDCLVNSLKRQRTIGK